MTSGPLSGRTALITGASRGLGREIATYFSKAGASLVLIARDPIALEEAAHEARSAKLSPLQTVHAVSIDITNREAQELLAVECFSKYGGIEILVNNAAIQGPIGAFEQVCWTEWRSVFETNFFAAVHLSRLFIPDMRQRRWGKLISISGGGATSPRPDFSAYAASKAALVRWSETLAEELRSVNIDVNCVAPGAMNTRMLHEVLAAGPEAARGEYARALEQVKSGGIPPLRAAELAAFLASPASDGISGKLISAVWDDWIAFPERREELGSSDVFTLRRIGLKDRGLEW